MLIVPIVKSDGRVRICGDYKITVYKITVNRAAKLDKYPIPPQTTIQYEMLKENRVSVSHAVLGISVTLTQGRGIHVHVHTLLLVIMAP